MDTLFLALKKLLVGTMFVVFAFVMVYVPQAPTSTVATVEAQWIVSDPGNTTQNLWGTIQQTLSTVMEKSGLAKTFSLDKIAWSMAKRAVTMMAADFLAWVNSGFEGQPMFVRDLRGFITGVADAEIGSFIEGLGDVGSFICEPFRLDVRIAVAIRMATVEDRERTAPSCTLSGVIDNIQGFIDGTDPGRGLADWLTITATPQTYTPYGALLSAEAKGRASLINAQGEEIELLKFGGGFLSQSVCEIIEGTDEEDCAITTPGVTIAGQVNKVLGLNQDILVQADEINEYIGELVTALANQAIIGGAGLLGLTGGGGSGSGGSSNGSILDQLRNEADNQAANSLGNAIDTLNQALRAERDYRATNQELLDELAIFISDSTNSEAERTIASFINEEVFSEIQRSDENIISLATLIAQYTAADANEQIEIYVEYSNLNITTPTRKAENLNGWRTRMSTIGIPITDPALDAAALSGITRENVLPKMETDLQSEQAFMDKLTYYRIHFQANRSVFDTLTYPNGYVQRVPISRSARDTAGEAIREIDLQRESIQNNIDRLEFLIERHTDANSQETDQIIGNYQTIPLLNDLEIDVVFDAWDRDAEREEIYSPSIVYEHILENDIPVTAGMIRVWRDSD